MNDKSTAIKQLKEAVEAFVREREWEQFHTLKNLSMALAVEAAELMEYFLWTNNADEITDMLHEKKEGIEDEVADIFIALLSFCNRIDIDLAAVFERKLASPKEKYPVEKCRGKCGKYTDL